MTYAIYDKKTYQILSQTDSYLLADSIATSDEQLWFGLICAEHQTPIAACRESHEELKLQTTW